MFSTPQRLCSWQLIYNKLDGQRRKTMLLRSTDTKRINIETTALKMDQSLLASLCKRSRVLIENCLEAMQISGSPVLKFLLLPHILHYW